MSSCDLDFLYKDEYLFAVKKPSNIHSVINNNTNNPSIAEELLILYPDLKFVAKREDAGLLNRLDFETSGILFGAWKKEYYENFHNINKWMSKTYLAVCEGKTESRAIETYIGGAYRGSKKVKVYELDKAPKRALVGKSDIKLLKYDEKKDLSLVSIKVIEARRHQIRAHLAYLGTPLLGDAVYGGKRKVSDYFNMQIPVKFLLHNENLSLRNLYTGKLVKINCECDWLEQF